MRALGPLWRLYDRLYGWWHELRDLPARDGAYLRMELARYRGRAVRLPDGTLLRRGQRVMLLHLHSRTLGLLAHQLVSPARTGIAFRRILRDCLETLAARLDADPALADVRAVGALTTFWQGSGRFGFAVFPLRHRWWARIVAAYQLSLTRQHALPRATWPPRRWAAGRAEARIIWISTEALRRRFGRARRRVDRHQAPGLRRVQATAPGPPAPHPTQPAVDLRRAGPL